MQSVSIAAAHWLRQQQEVFQISTGDIVGFSLLRLFFILFGLMARKFLAVKKRERIES